jgi:L-2-hydroxyglutarate oxidase LhgO
MGSVTTDFLIVGGGVIGVNLALQAKKDTRMQWSR